MAVMADSVQGWWRPVPPVWRVPRFDPGPLTPQALAEAAAELVARPAQTDAVDVVVERFLVVANAVARDDLEGARSALQGLPTQSWASGVALAAWWVSSKDDQSHEPVPTRSSWVGDPLWERETAVFDRLGQVPCLLSEPTWLDLRIDPADLLGRLDTYARAGVAASTADLALALTRLDTTYGDDDVRRGLLCLGSVPVVDTHGRVEQVTAGPVVLQYLATPFHLGAWDVPAAERPEVRFVRGVVDAARRHIDDHNWVGDTKPSFAVVPWCEAALKICAYELDSAQGVRLRQIARCVAPLPPAAATDMLTVQRAVHPEAASEVTQAVSEAWDRGLLRPGVPDARHLAGAPSDAVARVLGALARDGMLAVVWPLLDDLLAQAASAPQLPAGTVDVAETVATLLPEVVHAVGAGLAEPAALDLPGTRALTARPGTSRAVTVARQVVADLALADRPRDGVELS